MSEQLKAHVIKSGVINGAYIAVRDGHALLIVFSWSDHGLCVALSGAIQTPHRVV